LGSAQIQVANKMLMKLTPDVLSHKFHSPLCSKYEGKLLFIKTFKQLIYQQGCKLIKDVSWEFHSFIIKLGHSMFAILYLYPVGLWFDLDWIVNPFQNLDLDLDCQSHICDGFGLD